MNVCFYHQSDLDGHCSGAIYAHAKQKAGEEFVLHGIDYGDPIPWNLVDGNDLTVIDWSFQPWALFCEVIQRAASLLWIDHHKSAIEMWQQNELPSGTGNMTVFLDMKRAGCELAWDAFFPSRPMPTAVWLLGRYDVWDHANERVLPFQYRMRLEETDPAQPGAMNLWFPLLEDVKAILPKMIEEGAILLRYQRKQDAGDVSHTWFPIEWEGKRWQACNRTGKGSTFFESVWDRKCYHGMMTWGWTGKYWRIRLYSDRPDVDCSEIAKRYSGGGHKGAAGFQCAALPFLLPMANPLE